MSGWEEGEPGLRDAFVELGRLKRRALAHPLRPLLLALAVALVAVAMRARKPRSFESQVVLRVTESDIDAATAPRPAKELRAYVLDAAFSKEALLDLIHRFHLYPRELARDPTQAIDSMRDDIEVDVWRNYFIEERDVDDPGRSARIAVTFHAHDRRLAYDVARALGQVIVEHEERRRAEVAVDANTLAKNDVDAAREDLVRRRAEIVKREQMLLRAKPAEGALLRIEIQNMQAGLVPLEGQLDKLTRRQASLALRQAMEEQHLGLRFDVVDPGHPAEVGISRPAELAVIGLVVFLLCLPLGALATGAFDPRVYDADDVRRLGLEPIGRIEPFPGDNAGALDARLAREHHVK